MLDTILRIVTAEGAGSVAGLARRLEVSEGLVAAMLEELTRQGYLKAIVVGGRGTCQHCPLRTACLFAGRQRIWMLSRKSERLLAKR